MGILPIRGRGRDRDRVGVAAVEVAVMAVVGLEGDRVDGVKVEDENRLIYPWGERRYDIDYKAYTIL